MLQDFLTHELLYVLSIIITTLISVLVSKVITYIKSKTNQSQQELIQSITYSIVKYVQQKYGNESNQEKLKYAIQLVSEKLKEKKINVSTSDIELLIESAVITLKNELSNSWTKK